MTTAPVPASTVQASAGAPGYRARRTLPFRVEAIRQFRRRRTLIALSILMILPWVLVGAFEISGPASGVPTTRPAPDPMISDTRPSASRRPSPITTTCVQVCSTSASMWLEKIGRAHV